MHPRLPPLLVALALLGGLFSFPAYSLQVWTCATGVLSDGTCPSSSVYQVPTEFLNNDSYVLMSNNLSPSQVTYYQTRSFVGCLQPTQCKYVQLKDQTSTTVPLGTSPQYLQTVFPSSIGTYSGGSSGGTGSTFNFQTYLNGTDAKEFFAAGITIVSIFFALGYCYRALLSMLS